MRNLLLAGAMTIIGSAAFASPPPTSFAPISVTETSVIHTTGGSQVNLDVHTGTAKLPIDVANSLTVKLTTVVGVSSSVTAKGFTTP
jgi:hypothetical protein